MIFTTNHKKMEEFREACKSVRLLVCVIERNVDDEELVAGALTTLGVKLSEAKFLLDGIGENWVAKNADFKGYYASYSDIYQNLLSALNVVRHKTVMSEKNSKDYFSYKNPQEMQEKFNHIRARAKELDNVMKEKIQYLTAEGKKTNKVKKPHIFDMFKSVDSDEKIDKFANNYSNSKGEKYGNQCKHLRGFGSDAKADRLVNSYSNSQEDNGLTQE